MNTKLFSRFTVCAVLAFLLAGCATAEYPFLSPEDQALKARVEQKVALYSDVINVSVVDRRVYLTGNCVDIYGLVETVVDEVRHMEGVRAVFEDVVICGDRDGDGNWP